MAAGGVEGERNVDGRVAGVAYLVTIAAGMFAEVHALGPVRAGGDAAGTLASLHASEGLYRAAIFGDWLMIAAYAVVTAGLYRLFEPVSPRVSLVAALFSLLGLALLSVSAALLVVPLHLDGPGAAYDALRLHGATFGLTNLFFGPYCLLIGWLVLRSGVVPRWIGWLMAIAGAVFILDTSLSLLAPELARAIPDAVTAVSLIAEGSLALWLTAFGVRRAA